MAGLRQWSRRSVLSTALAAGVVGAVPALAGDPVAEVVVLGAGIAGLSAALTLHDAGIRPLVLEGSGRLGGRIFSTTGEIAPDLVQERGGAFINSDHADMRALAERFGLSLFDRVADERAHRQTPRTAFQFEGQRIPEAELADRLRPLAKAMRHDARRLRRRYDRVARDLDGQSVTDYLDAFGDLDPAARALCEAVIRSDYGVEPSASSALELLYALPRVRGRHVTALSESDERYTVIGGNQRVCEAMARALPEGAIRRHAWVSAIEERPDDFAIQLRDGEVVRARHVIATIPFPVLRQLSLSFRPPEPSALLAAIARHRLGRNEKVVLGVDGRVWQRSDGFRAELWSDRGLVWEASRLQPDHAIAALTVYLGGDQVDVLDAPLDARSLAATFAPAVPGLRDALTGTSLVTRWRDNPFSLGAYTSFPPGVLTHRDHVAWTEDGPANVACRGFLVAGEHVSDTWYGYMNGGAETGRRAAEAIIARRLDA
ncbi:MAG: NAD(P)/FAD-dependent oxidoreductase [Myxococcota bacterium]